MTSLDDDEFTFRYDLINESDIVLIFEMVAADGNKNGQVYRFYLHKQILALNCKYFENIFSEDKTASEITLPKSFIWTEIANANGICITIQELRLFFDTIYSIPSRCWWSLTTTEQKKQYNLYLIHLASYTCYTTFLNVIEDYLIQDYLNKNEIFTASMGAIAFTYKMNRLEEFVVSRVEDILKLNPRGNYCTFIQSWVNNRVVPYHHLVRYLKAVCEK